jgi:hypothetical protein
MVFGGIGLAISPLMLWFNRANPSSGRLLRLLPEWHATFTNYSTVLGMAFALMLLVAGMKLKNQRQSARTLHLFYGVGTLVIVVLSAVLLFVAWGSINTARLGYVERAGVTGGIIGGLFGSIMGAAYPIFLLIWFSRSKIKADIARWPEY